MCEKWVSHGILIPSSQVLANPLKFFLAAFIGICEKIASPLNGLFMAVELIRYCVAVFNAWKYQTNNQVRMYLNMLSLG